MDNNPLLLDNRKSEDIYLQALDLAKYYCPEWASKWEPYHFDPDDPGLVILRLFSNMAEYTITQFNRIPEKHKIIFLDFMGIDVRSARPAIVPLTFYLAEGSSIAQVPAGTLVASSKDPDVVFETMQHLTAITVKLYPFSINAWNDSYVDHSTVLSGERSFLIFAKDKDEKPLEHILYLGDDDIFDGKKTPFKNVIIKFRGYDLSPEYFEQWFNGQGLHINVEIIPEQKNKESLVFNINNFNIFEKSIINDVQSFWILTRPNKKKKIIHGSDLPRISIVTVDVISGNIIPEFIFFGNTPLDIKKGFYPFGEAPKEGDVLYIGSSEALTKKNSTMSLNIELDKDLDNKAIELIWEFWDGQAWKILPIIQDNTNGFTKSGISRIEFICPAITESEINGQSNRWIRVKIKSGGYGSPGKFENIPLDSIINSLPESLDRKAIKNELEKKGMSFGVQYIQPAYNPPFIKSINFVYNFKDKKIKHIMAYNNFSYEKFTSTDTIIPFKPFEIDRPAFYIGFEKIEANIQISLYFSIKEKYGTEKSTVKWKYYDGSKWKELSVENDETDSFDKSGIISFLFPQEIKKSLEFGKELFWIRIESENQQLYPEIKGIFPNTVWASNKMSVNSEILGSGNGLPGQSFSFSRKPVLSGQVIEVKEGETLIKWRETSSFAISSKLSRDYIIDRKEGIIFFGDGKHGMIPPKGMNNIFATYRSGGGKKGNQEIGIINTLRKANKDIERVTNHTSSSGGADDEDSDAAVFRGPHTIKNGGYAVTAEDFEWLAREASPQVIRAKAMLGDKDKIQVIILTDGKNGPILPEKNLIDSVGKYIKERAFFIIQEKIHILGPEYRRVDLEVTVKPLFVNESSIVIEKIKKRLSNFLDPVRGGKFAKGYDFGEGIYVSDVAANIEEVEGIDYVEELTLKKIIEDNVVAEVSDSGYLSIEKNALPFAGKFEVTITK